MGSVFKPKAPKIETPAPAVDEPIREPEAPELGFQESAEQKKKKGKQGLKIDLKSSATTSKGANIL